ncbi:alpha/beta hydrolase [Leucobacter sp. cx-328]|uniref:alpha/beta fold hydrolase n=1 Tax=unclassified Leucobacter TaxID=2621730 RepID=UPI00165DABE9|nr:MULTISPECIES: alpha/beta hydrolase [unclassified Leucobacter]MBC9945101.1 alpha/beta hydrolase [Leucobacter sp. cx-328]
MTGQDRTYRAGEIEIAFTDTPGPTGKTFVLIHGIGMGRVTFTEVASDLAVDGRVLALDLPGFGDSPEPGTTTSLEETARVVTEFIRSEAPGRVHLVGHSMGTQIVAEIALHHPDLVASLVLIAPTVNKYERTATKQALRMVQDLTGEDPKVIFTGMWEYLHTSPRWFASKLKFMLHHHLERLCPHIQVPTLVIRGETDRVCPRTWVSEVAEAIPHARMEEIPGRGHEAIIKSAQPVAEMVREFTTPLR